jgi:hypothetical protein
MGTHEHEDTIGVLFPAVGNSFVIIIYVLQIFGPHLVFQILVDCDQNQNVSIAIFMFSDEPSSRRERSAA